MTSRTTSALDALAARHTKFVDAQDHEVFVSEVNMRPTTRELRPYWHRRYEDAHPSPYQATRAVLGALLSDWFWESEIAFEVYDEET